MKLQRIVVAVLWWLAASSSAACPDGYPDVPHEFRNSGLVLTGVVMASRVVRDSSDGYFLDGEIYTVRVTHIYRGKARNQIQVFSENSSGRFPMGVGDEYLLFLYRDHGRWQVNNCGNSEEVSRATQALQLVKRLAAEQAKQPSRLSRSRPTGPA